MNGYLFVVLVGKNTLEPQATQLASALLQCLWHEATLEPQYNKPLCNEDPKGEEANLHSWLFDPRETGNKVIL